jgi:hypothetical protein
VLVLTDWPLGWTFWIDHPFVAALAAGLVLLLLTGSVLDVILRRREARRWRDLGRGAAYALEQLFYLSRIAMLQLLGARSDIQLTTEVELQVAPARARAIELLGPLPTPVELDLMIEYTEAGTRKLRSDRLPVLIQDDDWCDHAVLTLLALSRLHETTIARWIGAFGTLGDNEGFRRIGGSIHLTDRIEVIGQHLLVLRRLRTVGGASEPSELETSTRAVVDHWGELARAYDEEALYWEARRAAEIGAAFDDFPITRERVSRTPVGP